MTSSTLSNRGRMTSYDLSDLFDRVRAGLDWGRIGPWPPDGVTALEDLRKYYLGTGFGTSVTPSSDDPKNTGSKPEDEPLGRFGSDEANTKTDYWSASD